MQAILLIGHGYIGSFLERELTAAGHAVEVCDQDAHALEGLPRARHARYQSLTAADLADFDAVLWFAGHSNARKSLDDPDGALANNCLDLLQFARRKPSGTRLIYASTGSLYSGAPGNSPIAPPESSESEARLNPINPYDCSKAAFDALAQCFTTGLTGLRLGTASGHSPRLCEDLVFNAMNCTALREGRVRLANPHAHRSILFLDDLAHYVLRLLELPDALPPILNVASCNVTFGELARDIAAFHGARIEPLADSKTYSFQMDVRRIRALCGTPREMSMAERCAAFTATLARPRSWFLERGRFAPREP